MTNQLPSGVAARLAFLQTPAQTPYERARRLHMDALAFLHIGQPQNAVKAEEQALAALDGHRLSPTSKDLQKNVQSTLARAYAKIG